MPAFLRCFRPVLILGIAACCLVSPALAQDDDDEPNTIFSLGKKPFIYASASSANQLKEKVGYVFDTAGHPDTLDTILGLIDKNVNGLDGLNWEKPAGLMMFLNSVYPPSFETVAALPISDVDQFKSMMELGTQVMREKRDSENENHYQLITPRRNIQIRIEGGYAFVQMPWMDPDAAFTRDLPDAAALFSGLKNQFDAGITLDVTAVPKPTRQLIMNFLTSTMSTQMQQRDGEADSTYELRRSWMQADIDGLKLFFNEIRTMSLGVRVNPDLREANIDLVMDVDEGGELLEEILASSSKPSYFTPILTEDSPVSLCWSAIAAQRDIDRWTNALEALKGESARVIEEQELGEVPGEGSALWQALTAMQESIKEGHLDVFGQMYNDTDGKIALVGAMRVEDGDLIGNGLADIMARVQNLENFPEDDIKLQMNVAQHEGINFHRMEILKADAGAKEIFGNGLGMTIGCSGRTMWMCVGGDGAFGTLTDTMDNLVAAYENPVDASTSEAMRLIVKVNELIQLGKSADAANTKEREAKAAEAAKLAGKEETEEKKGTGRGRSERDKRIAQWRERRATNRNLFAETLAEGDDRIRLDVRPTDSGMRTRVTFEEGFIKAIGRVIQTNFENGE